MGEHLETTVILLILTLQRIYKKSHSHFEHLFIRIVLLMLASLFMSWLLATVIEVSLFLLTMLTERESVTERMQNLSLSLCLCPVCDIEMSGSFP